jgi:hypothetical protein
MRNVRLRTNVLCTRLEDEKGQEIASARFEDLRFRLTYFELIALRDANGLLFPRFWAEHSELSEAQRYHRDAFLRDYRDPPWEPELQGFVPFEPAAPEEPVAINGSSVCHMGEASEISTAAVTKHPSPEEGQAQPRGPEPVRAQRWGRDAPIVSQESIVGAGPRESLLVLAPPGTGKTHVLIERLVYLLTQGRFASPATELLVLSFTRATVAEVQRRLTERIGASASDDLRYVAVTTFDAYATRVLAESGNERLLHADAVRGDETSYDARIRSLAELLERGGGHQDQAVPASIASLRYLIVDEIQDLVGPRARLVLALIRIVHANGGGVLLLGDPAQAIYDFTDPRPNSRDFLAGLRVALAQRGQEVALGKFHRFADPEMEQLVRNLWEAVGRDGSDPDGEALRHILYGLGPARSFAELAALSASQRGVAILVRNNAQANQVVQWLSASDLPCTHHLGESGRRWPAGLARVFLRWKQDVMSRPVFDARIATLESQAGKQEAERVLHALQSCGVLDSTQVHVGRLRQIVSTRPPPSGGQRHGGLVVSTVHRSKGLEYDTVLLLEPEFAEDTEELRILYVAATRARRKLYLLHADRQIVRPARKAGKTGYWVERNRVFLNQSHDLDPNLFSERLVPGAELPVLQEQLWSAVSSTTGPRGQLFLCLREQNGRQYFTVALQEDTVFCDICLCNENLSKALWGRRRSAADLGSGQSGWPVRVEGLETIAFPANDASATEALGAAGMAWLPVLTNPVMTDGGDES